MPRVPRSLFLLILLISSLSGSVCFAVGQQEATTGKAVLYAQAGILSKLTSTEAHIAIISSGHPQTLSFLINKKAFIEKLNQGDRVNAIYTKRNSQNILVILQRLPNLFLGPPPGQDPDEHLGVAELQIPQKQSDQILQIVGPIEPSLNAPYTAALVNVSDIKEQKGTVSNAKWLNPAGYELYFQANTSTPVDGPQGTIIFIDPFTRIEGDIKKGSQVEIQYKDENGQKIATLVEVTQAPPDAASKSNTMKDTFKNKNQSAAKPPDKAAAKPYR